MWLEALDSAVGFRNNPRRGWHNDSLGRKPVVEDNPISLAPAGGGT